MKYVESTSPDLGLLRNHPVDEPGPPPFGSTEEQEAHAVILLRSQDDIIHLHVADMLESQQYVSLLFSIQWLSVTAFT